MPRAVAIANGGQAFEVVKEMQAEGLAWGDDYRPLGRAALARILEERMATAIDRHLERMAELGEADRRNGGYARHLLTALGSIELAVPRTRRFSAGAVLRAYARREAEVDRMILACFVLGLSTRKSLPPRRRGSGKRSCRSLASGSAPRR
jgi:putative transposase